MMATVLRGVDMIKRKLSKNTQIKVLEIAAEILNMHGSVAGSRVCQDWSGTSPIMPSAFFTKQEADDLYYNHEILNSELEDYDEDYCPIDDEMCVSFIISDAIEDIKREMKQ